MELPIIVLKVASIISTQLILYVEALRKYAVCQVAIELNLLKFSLYIRWGNCKDVNVEFSGAQDFKSQGGLSIETAF